ncbi:MAG: putative dsRNA-binding protein [Oscillospiraceae bacterium]|nr:putative dsRNA-binding protein [Oscillospiraceae bacterium]
MKYTVIEEIGPDHDKRFTVEVECDGKKMAEGQGHTKKAAEMEAAKCAIEKL